MNSTTLILSSNVTDFTTFLDEPIYLEDSRDYKAAFLYLFTYNSLPNITEANNKFQYYNGTEWKDVILQIGAYEVTEINDEIHRQMMINDDYDKTNNVFYIDLSFNKPTARCSIDISHDNYKINLKLLGVTLGFPSHIKLKKGFHESPLVIDIEPVNTILVHCDFVKGSYLNNKLSQILYSFTPNVSPGYKIIETPKPQLLYYPVVKCPKIHKVRVWLTDQNNKLIDLRGEKITIGIRIEMV